MNENNIFHYNLISILFLISHFLFFQFFTFLISYIFSFLHSQFLISIFYIDFLFQTSEINLTENVIDNSQKILQSTVTAYASKSLTS